MSDETICIRCNGTGSYRGLGFMEQDCDLCNHDDYAEKEASKKIVSLDKVDRRSKSYKDAIKDIMKLDKKITRQEAERMFDDAYQKNG